jgi:GDSL-like Lipase/Acylhydrolase family
VVWVLAASLVVNVLLLLLVGRRLRQQGLREVLIRAGVRRAGNADFARAARLFVASAPGGVVFVGDSQVARAPLLEMLTPFRNRGIARATIANVEAWFDGVLAEDPAHVVLWIGGNDVYFGLPLPESVAAMRRLLDAVARQGCVATLVSAPPLPGREAAIGELNAALAALAVERGCGWVDLVPTLAEMAWTDDGIHLNAAAYRAVAPSLAAAVQAPEHGAADR